MWFLLEGLDSVSAIMESVAVLRMNSKIKVLSFFRCTSPSFFHIANPSIGTSLDSSFPDPFFFVSDRSFDFGRERRQLCQRIQFICLFSFVFIVPSCPRLLSLAGLNADGTRFLEPSLSDDGLSHLFLLWVKMNRPQEQQQASS
jgi:hypothetical protein